MRWIDRPELAPISDGLVVTYLAFAPDSNCGEVYVELRGRAASSAVAPFVSPSCAPRPSPPLPRSAVSCTRHGRSATYWGALLRVNYEPRQCMRNDLTRGVTRLFCP